MRNVLLRETLVFWLGRCKYSTGLLSFDIRCGISVVKEQLLYWLNETICGSDG